MNDRSMVIAVSLKMYFDPAETIRWSTEVARFALGHSALLNGDVQLVVFPSLPVLGMVIDIFGDTAIAVGAQDLFYEDRGPFTGAVSGADLQQIGCKFVEIGHMERRRLFGEDDRVVNLKVQAAWRNGLRPLVCVGEDRPGSVEDAVQHCLSQLAAAIDEDESRATQRSLVVAYEPNWAIGAELPADPAHIKPVIAALQEYLATNSAFARAPVIYGGSASSALVHELADVTDGIFLGRFAHDPAQLKCTIDETLHRY